MIYIVVYSIAGKEKTVIANNIGELTDIIAKYESIGKQKTILLYEAEQIDYTFILEDKSETVITKVPKVTIVK